MTVSAPSCLAAATNASIPLAAGACVGLAIVGGTLVAAGPPEAVVGPQAAATVARTTNIEITPSQVRLVFISSLLLTQNRYLTDNHFLSRTV
jgi:energy-converting hydrogenase Eha subunit E